MKNTIDFLRINISILKIKLPREGFLLPFFFVLIIFFIGQNSALAKVYRVGSSRTFTSPNALNRANVLQDGDIVEIDAEIFIGENALAKWSVDNLTILGVGGRPHLKADGKSLEGKAIWIVDGSNIVIDNFEFSGASVPDGNGAGIRQQGVNVVIRNCYFHDNETAFLSSHSAESHIIIEQSEFSYNGIGNGYSHNVYIGRVGKFTFRYNYSHHANVGQTLKSRAVRNIILYNRIMDENTGESSRLIDLSNGGFAIIMGNVLMQGSNSKNGNLVGFGHEGLENQGPHEFYFINNTCVNKRTSYVNFITVNSMVPISNISNNIFAGSHTSIFNGALSTYEGNLIENDINKIGFFDESIYDYRLTEGSPAIDMGVEVKDNISEAISLVPKFTYYHPRHKNTRVLLNEIIDVGAYEMDPNAKAYEVSKKR